MVLIRGRHNLENCNTQTSRKNVVSHFIDIIVFFLLINKFTVQLTFRIYINFELQFLIKKINKKFLTYESIVNGPTRVFKLCQPRRLFSSGHIAKEYRGIQKHSSRRPSEASSLGLLRRAIAPVVRWRQRTVCMCALMDTSLHTSGGVHESATGRPHLSDGPRRSHELEYTGALAPSLFIP